MSTEKGVQEILSRCSPPVRDLVEVLRALVQEAAPDATEEGHTGWGNITYSRKSIFCYIGPQKSWANLGFWQGTELSDPEGLLEGTGKRLRHVKVRKPEEIRSNAFKALVQEAYRLSVG